MFPIKQVLFGQIYTYHQEYTTTFLLKPTNAMHIKSMQIHNFSNSSTKGLEFTLIMVE